MTERSGIGKNALFRTPISTSEPAVTDAFLSREDAADPLRRSSRGTMSGGSVLEDAAIPLGNGEKTAAKASSKPPTASSVPSAVDVILHPGETATLQPPRFDEYPET